MPMCCGAHLGSFDFLVIVWISKKAGIVRSAPTLCLCNFRASDLVMKVDALLSSQPKVEARMEHTFAEDKYRYITSSESLFPII